MKRFPLPALLMAAVLAGCASLPPGSDFPKAASSALAQPEATRLGRHFAGAVREHGGHSAFRMLAVGVDGFLTRAQMVNAAERTLDLQYFIFRADETGKLVTEAVLRAADRGVRVRVLVDDGETIAGDEQLAALDAHPQIEVRIFNPFAYRGHFMFFRALEFTLSNARLDYRMHNKLMVVDSALALIRSPELARQIAARLESMVSPPNSYALTLLPHDGGGSPRLVWRTEEDGKAVAYDTEPARSSGQRLRVNLLSLLPLDAEL